MRLETKVGAFFLGTIAILCLLILRAEKLDIFSRKAQRHFNLGFQQVAGLAPQSKVRVAGVPVGTVEEILLDNGGKARVVIGIPPEVQIYGDASAQLSNLGILGEKYVDLNQGTPAAGPMPENGMIATRETVNLDNLMESLSDISKDVKGITGALNQTIGGEDGQRKLDEIVDNIRALTAEFRTMTHENHAAINTTIANAQAITTDLRERLPRLAQQYEDLGRHLNEMAIDAKPEVKGMVSDVRKLAQNFQATSDSLRSITDKINRGEGTIGKLINDETTVKKINQAVDNMNDLMGGMKAMELRMDLSAANWTERNQMQGGLDLELAPRPDYWYALGLHTTPDGKVSERTQRLSSNPGHSWTTREVTTDQSFTFSAQFAKRLGDHFVVSAGVIDNKAGGGVEYRAMEDRLRIGALAYDFTKREGKPHPRYRLTTSYQFWKGMYAQAGVQDIANRDLRTFFVGAGVRWKDDELKKMLGLLGASVK